MTAMNSALITGVSAVLGAVVGSGSTIVLSLFTSRQQANRERERRAEALHDRRADLRRTAYIDLLRTVNEAMTAYDEAVDATEYERPAIEDVKHLYSRSFVTWAAYLTAVSAVRLYATEDVIALLGILEEELLRLDTAATGVVTATVNGAAAAACTADSTARYSSAVSEFRAAKAPLKERKRLLIAAMAPSIEHAAL